ncbi:MAG TPA: glycosyltransferase [bacterium]|nr:glycosyltransferase [bacterium]
MSAERFITIFEWFILVYFLLVNAVYLFLTVLAFFRIRRYMRRHRIADGGLSLYRGFYKPISIVVPAYNEEVSIVDSVESILLLNYPEFEVVVVNDGSTDETFDRLRGHFSLVEITLDADWLKERNEIRSIWTSRTHKVMVVNKVNGGKASALNTGINVARYPLVCNIDADSILDRNALLMIARPFLEDNRVIASGGIVRVANSCDVYKGEVREARFPRSALAGFQVVEYLRAFLMGRIGWDALNGLFIISGAFGLFDKAALKLAGGYAEDSVGEDMELVVRMHRFFRSRGEDKRITFIPDPVCWTEVPESFRQLGRQRDRWQRGLMDALWRHRVMIFNPRYGAAGLFVYPYFFFIEMLGPLVELGGYLLIPIFYGFGVLDASFFIAYLLFAFFIGGLITLFSVLLEEMSFRKYRRPGDLIRLLLFSLVETFLFRPLTVLWRVKGMVKYLFGSRSWGKMQRKGFAGGGGDRENF